MFDHCTSILTWSQLMHCFIMMFFFCRFVLLSLWLICSQLLCPEMRFCFARNLGFAECLVGLDQKSSRGWQTRKQQINYTNNCSFHHWQVFMCKHLACADYRNLPWHIALCKVWRQWAYTQQVYPCCSAISDEVLGSNRELRTHWSSERPYQPASYCWFDDLRISGQLRTSRSQAWW